MPTQSWDLLECPDFAEYDTSSLVSIGGGGAPAPPELVKRVESNFKGRPNIGYGMTETNAYGPGNTGDDYVTPSDRAPGDGSRCSSSRCATRTAMPVPTGETGEIWFKGPHLIRGYWNKPEATAETIVDGWLRSGDLGRVDDDGFVYVMDRVKDMVLRAGENVYCAEVEAAIYEHPAVYEAAVFGVPHERLGEEVAAVIMRRPGADLTDEELTAFLRERIAGVQDPDAGSRSPTSSCRATRRARCSSASCAACSRRRSAAVRRSDSAAVEGEVEALHGSGEDVALDHRLGDDAQVREAARHLAEHDLQLDRGRATGRRTRAARTRTRGAGSGCG